MTNVEIQTALKACQADSLIAEKKARALFNEFREALLAPIKAREAAIKTQCPHIFFYTDTHPHSGDEYYKCSICGTEEKR